MLKNKRSSAEWLSAPGGIRAGQWQQEFLELMYEFHQLQPTNILELGTWEGGTLYHFMQAAAYGSLVISVDKGPEHWRPAQPAFDCDRWLEWERDGVKLEIVKADSHADSTVERIRELSGGKLDFVFIDADHTYEGAKLDFENYGRLVQPGGIVAFHDLITPWNKPHIQVQKLWREIRLAGYKVRELYSHPRQEWGGIGVVYI